MSNEQTNMSDEQKRKDIIKTAKRIFYLRRCEPEDSENYESQLKNMSKEYGLIIDLKNDKVRFKENNK